MPLTSLQVNTDPLTHSYPLFATLKQFPYIHNFVSNFLYGMELKAFLKSRYANTSIESPSSKISAQSSIAV